MPATVGEVEAFAGCGCGDDFGTIGTILGIEEHRDFRGAIDGLAAVREFQVDVELVVLREVDGVGQVDGVESGHGEFTGFGGPFVEQHAVFESIEDLDVIGDVVGRGVEAHGLDLVFSFGGECIEGAFDVGHCAAPAVVVVIVNVFASRSDSIF